MPAPILKPLNTRFDKAFVDGIYNRWFNTPGLTSVNLLVSEASMQWLNNTARNYGVPREAILHTAVSIGSLCMAAARIGLSTAVTVGNSAFIREDLTLGLGAAINGEFTNPDHLTMAPGIFPNFPVTAGVGQTMELNSRNASGAAYDGMRLLERAQRVAAPGDLLVIAQTHRDLQHGGQQTVYRHVETAPGFPIGSPPVVGPHYDSMLVPGAAFYLPPPHP